MSNVQTFLLPSGGGGTGVLTINSNAPSPSNDYDLIGIQNIVITQGTFLSNIGLSSTYPGQSSITTLGTISTGVWNGTVLLGEYGGTGVANTGQTINLGSFFSGAVLTSDSSGNATWQPAPSSSGITTIDGDSGSVTNSIVSINTGCAFPTMSTGLNNGTLAFIGSGTTLELYATDVNSNTGFGAGCLALVGNTAGQNTAFGADCGPIIVSGAQGNCLFGLSVGHALTTGPYNSIFGFTAGSALVSGSYNAILGYMGGANYTSSESKNILLMSPGVGGDSAQTRIGFFGGSPSQTGCYIDGINSVDSSGFSSPLQVLVDSVTGQLGFGSAGSGIGTLDGNTGSASGSTVTISSPSGNGTISFSGTSATISLYMMTTDGNANLGIGINSLGFSSLSGNNNICIGQQAGQAVTSGSQNTLVGCLSTLNLVSGGFNSIFGTGAGYAYTGSESYNTIIGANTAGVIGDYNLIRIQDATSTTPAIACYIGGIDGVTVIGSAVLCSSTGQLGDVVSSKKFKENIEPITDSSILNLNPVKFNYISDKNKTTCYGMIAEEVEPLFPDLVLYKDGIPYSLKYHEMPALLLNEIQKLNARLVALEGKTA